MRQELLDFATKPSEQVHVSLDRLRLRDDAQIPRGLLRGGQERDPRKISLDVARVHLDCPVHGLWHSLAIERRRLPLRV